MLNNKKYILTTLLFYSVTFNVYSEDMPKEFDAKYKAYYQGDFVGYMDRRFYKENDFYIAESKSSIKGKYLFITVSDVRDEKSIIKVNEDFIYQPQSYIMNRTGSFADFVMTSDFNYDDNTVSMSYKDRKATKPFNDKNILDNLSYQIRIQHDFKNKNKTEVKHDIAYKTGFRDFDFKYIGEEDLTIDSKTFSSLKLKQIRSNKKGEKKGAFLWLDPNRDFVMTKLIYFNKKGKEEAKFELIDYKNK